MIFNEQLIIKEQLGNDINELITHTLTVVASEDSGLVTLCVTGIPQLIFAGGGYWDTQTIMTGDECLALVRILKAACQAADSEAVTDAKPFRSKPILSSRYPLKAMQERNKAKQLAFFDNMKRAAGLVA